MLCKPQTCENRSISLAGRIIADRNSFRKTEKIIKIKGVL